MRKSKTQNILSLLTKNNVTCPEVTLLKQAIRMKRKVTIYKLVLLSERSEGKGLVLPKRNSGY